MTAHNDYFNTLQAVLLADGVCAPTLVIDQDRLLHNLDLVRDFAKRSGHDLRVVEKSLPCPDLLSLVMQRWGSQRLMSFHLPFLLADVKRFPTADILLGKPMPVAAVAQFYRDYQPPFDPAKQLHWLIDTPQRLQQYLNFAQLQKLTLQVCIELDVGLHRGGVADEASLIEMLSCIRQHPQQLSFSGFMGYDAHVVKLPRILGSAKQLLAKSMSIYQQRVQLAKQRFADLWPVSPLLNTAGSPTYRLHENNALCTELAVGSALLKPIDFDVPTLTAHHPALFIATPVLKTPAALRLPGLPDVAAIQGRRPVFIYGGQWLADYVSPSDLKQWPIYGRSSNQDVATVNRDSVLAVDDLVFLRPTQSEAVLLQFGAIRVVSAGRVVAHWSVYND
ncbi:MAG: alanine racemase [Moraxellaceae bacterium]|nr:alanine racemase [Moraxellaceae bacterium]MDP1776323.1 alanine racemase [Moraxellaceae bacterium]